MEIFADTSFGDGYTNHTQQARRISEEWIARNGYCLRCDSDNLIQTSANTKSRDFICRHCEHGYELKSKRGVFTRKVLDGAYSAMIGTIRNGNTPTFLLLEYSASWSIQGLKAIHHSLITESSIEARRPLASTARRAGWIGCNIILPSIAVEGQISIIQNGKMQSKQNTRASFARLESLAGLSSANRSWAGTVLNLVHRLPDGIFTLSDMYAFESHLRELYPNNTNVRPKIRQQLQVLRDAGLINFLGGGRYELGRN